MKRPQECAGGHWTEAIATLTVRAAELRLEAAKQAHGSVRGGPPYDAGGWEVQSKWQLLIEEAVRLEGLAEWLRDQASLRDDRERRAHIRQVVEEAYTAGHRASARSFVDGKFMTAAEQAAAARAHTKAAMLKHNQRGYRLGSEADWPDADAPGPHNAFRPQRGGDWRAL